MCHLAGYVGNNNAASIILESLRIQEPIIGAQATGLAVLNDNEIRMEKTIGPVEFFEKQFRKTDFKGLIGIGHTRFALKNVKRAETNTREKAHPFWNSTKKFVTMHNGTISNFMEFVEILENKGYKFTSKSKYFDEEKDEEIVDFCDSEIFSYLLEEELKKKIEIKRAIRNACQDIKGQFAFVVLHPDFPETLFIANWMQPMQVGFSQESAFFTSFKLGFEPNSSQFPWKFSPPKNSLITLTKGNVLIEPLLINRSIPNFEPHPEKLKELVMEAIKNGFTNISSIWTFIGEHSEKIGLTKEKFEQLTTLNGYTFSPIIYETILELEKFNKVKRELNYVWEGGIQKTPRYNFYSID